MQVTTTREHNRAAFGRASAVVGDRSMILGHGSALIFHLKSFRARSKIDTPSR
jgi:hypothetical protein